MIHPREALFLARPGEQAALDAMYAELAPHCAAARLLTADEVLARAPVLRPELLQAALLDPTGQDIDVHALHQGFLRGFRQRGGNRAAIVTAAKGQQLHKQAPIQPNAVPLSVLPPFQNINAARGDAFHILKCHSLILLS